MKVYYEPGLVEEAVFLALRRAEFRGDPGPSRRFHEAVDPMRQIIDLEEKERRFAEKNLDWFRELGFDRTLPEVLKEFPRAVRRIPRALVVKCVRTKEEEGDLLEKPEAPPHDRRTLFLRVVPERFTEPEALRSFLRHELMHVADLLDPAFGYRRDPDLTGPSRTNVELVRSRFRTLWAAYVDGRLDREGRLSEGRSGMRRREFEGAFGFLGAQEASALFQEIWRGTNFTQADLIQRARDPRPAGSEEGCPAPLPGSPCPLCSFPTYDWADPAAMDEKARGLLQKEFPDWSAERRLCGQCADLYRSRSRFPRVILPGATPY